MAGNKHTELKYDCRVFIAPYNREPVKKTLYSLFYYEINKGLQTVNVNLNRNSIGTSTITLSLPLQEQFISNVLLKYDRKRKIESSEITFDQFIKKREELTKKYGSVRADQILDRNYRITENNNQEVFIRASDVTPEKETQVKIESVTESGDEWGILTDNAIEEDITSESRYTLFDLKDGSGFKREYFPILNKDFTECIFAPMDKVKIYMSNRFQGETIDETDIKQISATNKYSQVFEGLINRVKVNFNNGIVVVTLMAKDVTRWLEISQFNLNPAVASNILDSIYQNMGLKAYSTGFANFSLEDILEILIVGYKDKWLEITRKEYEAAEKKFEKDRNEEEFNQFRTNTIDEDVTDWEAVNNFSKNETITKLEGALNELEPSESLNDQTLLDTYNVSSKSALTFSDIEAIIIGEGLSDQRDDIMPTEARFQELKQNSTTASAKVIYEKQAPRYRGAGNFRLLKKNKGLRPGEDSELDNIRLETDFTNDKLWIDPSIPDWIPFQRMFNNFELFSHNYRPRLEIIKEITAITEFEFYMDSTGILICKVPDYNINPGVILSDRPDENNDNQHQDENKNKYFRWTDDKFLIKPEEIITYDKDTSDDMIKTYCIATGEFEFAVEEVAKINTDIAFDAPLAKNFGARIFNKKVPLLFGGKNKEARQNFAKAWLNRTNATYKSVSMTIPMRPELQLAKTTAILSTDLIKLSGGATDFNDYVTLLKELEDDDNDILNDIEVGYISGITHTWAPGSVSTTRLNLTHSRLWLQDFGTLAYNRSNITSEKASIDYQKLESQFTNKQNLEESANKRYQAFLTSKGYFDTDITGQVTDSDRKATNAFVADHNAAFSTNIELVREGENPYERSDILAIFQEEGITG
jgi:hypothetical protein